MADPKNDSPAAKSLKIPIGAQLAEVLRVTHACRRSVLLVGESGVGKSEFVRDRAEAMGLQAVVLNLALMEGAGELLGLPRVVGDETQYALPAFLPTKGVGIMILEEFSRMTPHVMAALYEFLTTRRIGQYELPPGWIIVACANPATADYDVSTLDKAMVGRFLCVQVTADRHEWIRWARASGIHRAVIEIARDDARLFRLHSPRTWTYTSQLVAAAEEIGSSAQVVHRIIASQLGSVETAHTVMKYLGGFPESEQIEPLAVLSRYATDEDLAGRVRAELKRGRTDAVERLVYGIEEIVTGPELAALIDAGTFDLESFERFAADVPGDRHVDLLRVFADNPVSGNVFTDDPAKAFTNYRRSTLRRRIVESHRSDRPHRVTALLHRVVAYLDQLDAAGQLAQVREEPKVKAALQRMLLDAQSPQNRVLEIGLRRLAIELGDEEAA